MVDGYSFRENRHRYEACDSEHPRLAELDDPFPVDSVRDGATEKRKQQYWRSESSSNDSDRQRRSGHLIRKHAPGDHLDVDTAHQEQQTEEEIPKIAVRQRIERAAK